MIGLRPTSAATQLTALALLSCMQACAHQWRRRNVRLRRRDVETHAHRPHKAQPRDTIVLAIEPKQRFERSNVLRKRKRGLQRLGRVARGTKTVAPLGQRLKPVVACNKWGAARTTDCCAHTTTRAPCMQ